MTTISFTTDGEPIAKKRPRFFKRGNFSGAYNPQQTEEGRWLTEVLTQLKKADGPIFAKGVPVELRCSFVFSRPKSHFGSGKNVDKLKPSAPEHHVQKPDCDNLEKFVVDCLNGIAWHDDCQVVMIHSEKKWGQRGHTAITITEI